MPSRAKSNPSDPRPTVNAPSASDLAQLPQPQRARARSLVLEMVSTYREARRPLPEQTVEYAVALGVFAAPAAAETIAATLIPECSAQQSADLASAKTRISRMVGELTRIRKEVRNIVSALHGSSAGRPAGEPRYVERSDAATVAALAPGRFHLDLSGPVCDNSGTLFTRAGDALAAELHWVTETEDQLADMIAQLANLAQRDEHRELLERRRHLVDCLSPAAAKSNAA